MRDLPARDREYADDGQNGRKNDRRQHDCNDEDPFPPAARELWPRVSVRSDRHGRIVSHGQRSKSGKRIDEKTF